MLFDVVSFWGLLRDASRSEDSRYRQWHFRIIAYSTCEGAWRRKDCCNLVNKRVNVKDIITHRLPLEDAGKGFKLVAEAKESIKVIIEPQR